MTRSSRLSSIGKWEAEAGGSPADEFSMKSKARLYTLIGLLSIAASVRAADETQATWPPPHMKGLPAEYQARQRRALETQLETINRLRPGVNPVLWVRFGIAGLALEKHVDRINGYIASKVSDFLVAQFLKDIPAYADLKYEDGSTARQQYEARLAYWHRWIDSRVRRGLFMEDGGSGYQNYTASHDPAIRRPLKVIRL